MPRALSYASSLLRDRTLADDVVHDCYLRLIGKAADYDLLSDGTKLLFRAVTNACIDRNSRERTLVSLDVTDGDGGRSNRGVEDVRTIGPVQAAMQKELEGVMEEGLGRLPVMQRAALELKSLGYTLTEIGETLGTSSDNAGVLVHRARKALAGFLADYLGPSNDG